MKKSLVFGAFLESGIEDNAFWNGDQMVYGDGDGELFQRFTKSIDVIGHELTHGVTQYQAGLQYDGESGALNESFSDVFGSLVKQKINNQTAEEADWLIGQGLLASTVKGIALRSMKAPGTAYDDPLLGKDPQPAHVKDKYTGTDDNGGVHINSGIPNYAFYLAAVAIGGYAWEKAGKIWYITLRDRLNAQADFKTAANVTIQVAGELYGNGSDEQKAVQDAWQKVGVISILLG
jgi:Zn-dependent metalloprotease